MVILSLLSPEEFVQALLDPLFQDLSGLLGAIVLSLDQFCQDFRLVIFLLFKFILLRLFSIES